MNDPFRNSPDLGNQFEDARRKADREVEPGIDRDTIDAHDELNHDPPEMAFDPERVLAPTPFGTIDVEVQQELDPAAQQAVREAQRQEHDVEHGFSDLRSIDDVPGAAQEYEAHLREQDDYEARIRDRFNHARERDLDLDR